MTRVPEPEVRVFLAVTPGDEWRQELSTRVDALRDELGSARALRWVPPEAWHLTLQFLGEWPERSLPGLQSQLEARVCPGVFTMKPGDPGAFPGWKRPRVLFLHQSSGGRAEELACQVRAAVEATWPEGPQDRKPFRAHLTLARVKDQLHRRQAAILQDWRPGPLPDWPVDSFQLISSVLRPGGAEHRILTSIPLSGA
jgi:2'-5' RNA ligase